MYYKWKWNRKNATKVAFLMFLILSLIGIGLWQIRENIDNYYIAFIGYLACICGILFFEHLFLDLDKLNQNYPNLYALLWLGQISAIGYFSEDIISYLCYQLDLSCT